MKIGILIDNTAEVEHGGSNEETTSTMKKTTSELIGLEPIPDG